MNYPIEIIVVHCSASDDPKQASFQAIKELHISHPSRKFQWGEYRVSGQGFHDIGYNYVIEPDGTRKAGRPIHKIGAHAKGYNRHSISICVVGNKKFTPEQGAKLKETIDELCYEFGLDYEDVKGHRDLPGVSKSCPNFDVQKFIETGDMEVSL